MRKFFLLFSALPLLFISSPVFAASNPSRVVILDASQTHNGDYFGFGNEVEILGTVNGDVYAAGSNVLISGKVNGDVLAAGGTVTISGEISQDIRVAGGEVVMSGKIGRNVTVGGNRVSFTTGSSVNGSVVAGGNHLNLAGKIAGDLRLGSTHGSVSGQVGGHIDAWAENLTLLKSAHVAGYLHYVSNNQASIASGVVSGEVAKTSPSNNFSVGRDMFSGFFSSLNIVLKILSFVNLLIVGLLLLKFFPILTQKLTSTLREKPLASFGIGFVGLIAIPVLALVLVFIVFTFPLGLSLLPLFIMALYYIKVIAAYLIGVLLLERFGQKVHDVFALILGVVVFSLLGFLPLVGGLLIFGLSIASFGALLITKKEIYSLAREKNIL